jgi:hypothetical protein
MFVAKACSNRAKIEADFIGAVMLNGPGDE